MIDQCYHHASTCCDKENRYLTENIFKYNLNVCQNKIIKSDIKTLYQTNGRASAMPPQGGIPRRCGDTNLCT